MVRYYPENRKRRSEIGDTVYLKSDCKVAIILILQHWGTIFPLKG